MGSDVLALAHAVGGHEDMDCAANDAFDLVARRRAFHVAEEAQLEETAACEVEELTGGEIDIVDLQGAGLHMPLQEVVHDGAQVLRTLEEALTEKGHSLAHTEHGTHGVDDLVFGHV